LLLLPHHKPLQHTTASPQNITTCDARHLHQGGASPTVAAKLAIKQLARLPLWHIV